MTAKTTTLAAWLLEQIAADEAAARDAALMAGDRGFGDERVERGQHWVASYHDVCRRRLEDNPGRYVLLEGRPLGIDAANHIARQDPAHVLRLCSALRAVVEMHGELLWWSYQPGCEWEHTGKCRVCADNEAADYNGAPLVAWPCPTLRNLAAAFADRPGFDEEWLA